MAWPVAVSAQEVGRGLQWESLLIGVRTAGFGILCRVRSNTCAAARGGQLENDLCVYAFGCACAEGEKRGGESENKESSLRVSGRFCLSACLSLFLSHFR